MNEMVKVVRNWKDALVRRVMGLNEDWMGMRLRTDKLQEIQLQHTDRTGEGHKFKFQVGEWLWGLKSGSDRFQIVNISKFEVGIESIVTFTFCHGSSGCFFVMDAFDVMEQLCDRQIFRD